MSTSPDPLRLARVALNALIEPGLRVAHDLLSAHDPPELFELLKKGELPDARLAAAVATRLAGRDPLRLATTLCTRAAEVEARLVIPEDDEWPSSLADLDQLHDESGQPTGSPVCLWVRGSERLDELLDRSVAIVGSRDASSYGVHMAGELAFGLADKGWTVVSGGAYGIDATAHWGAIHGRGPTVAVLACGVDRDYPRRNAELFAKIRTSGGLLISEWPPGSTPLKHRFLVRNRVIAAASRGTVVVEAEMRSGARNTARHAMELDRPLMIVPGPATSRYSMGVHELARGPGEVRLVTRASDIIADLGPLGEGLDPPPQGRKTSRDTLEPLHARILDAVPRRSAIPAELIAAQAGLAPTDARRALPVLLMHGLVDEREGKYRQTVAA